MTSEACDQIVYERAQVGNRGGYQVVASSPGVRPDELQFVDTYGVPLGVDPDHFQEGRRFLRLPSGRLAVNFLKNMGVGYDGRQGAVYSHMLVFDEDQFHRLGSDTGVFESGFAVKMDARGSLSTVTVQGSTRQTPDFEVLRTTMNNPSNLARMITAVLQGKTTVVVDPSWESKGGFLSSFLLIFPPSTRAITYTSYSAKPSQEPPTSVVFVPPDAADLIHPQLNRERVDLRAPTEQRRGGLPDEIGRSLAAAVFAGDSETLMDFHSKVSSYPESVGFPKRVEFWYFERLLKEEQSSAKRAEYALQLAGMGMSTEHSLRYHKESVREALGASDSSLLSKCYLSYLGDMAALGDSASFRPILEEAIQNLVQSPGVVVGFVSALAKSAPSQVPLIISTVIQSPVTRSSPDLLALVGADPAFMKGWVDMVLQADDIEAIPSMAANLATRSSEANASRVVSAAFRDERLMEDAVRYSKAVKRFVESKESGLLPPGVVAAFAEAADERLLPSIPLPKKGPRFKAPELALVAGSAVVFAVAFLMGSRPIPFTLSIPSVPSICSPICTSLLMWIIGSEFFFLFVASLGLVGVRFARTQPPSYAGSRKRPESIDPQLQRTIANDIVPALLRYVRPAALRAASNSDRARLERVMEELGLAKAGSVGRA